MLTCNDAHEYWLDGRLVLGCTESLKACGLVNTSFYTDEGQARGTEVHRRIKLFLTGHAVPASDAFTNYVLAARKYLDDSQLEVIHVEPLLCDPVLGIAGTPDLIAMTTPGNGRWRFVIPDWKTGGVERWHGLQLAIYEHLARVQGRVEGTVERLTVHLKDDGTYTTQVYKDRRDWKIAHAAITLENWRKNGGR